ncbi:MAG: orotate phosphoribosyltransferase, partial [Rhodobacteraceae bacterium]|nr:orotate phosphoribosyltransferase [Paracoccaceae bacterium]
VIFYYDIFPETLKKLKDHGTDLHYLCTWWDVLAVAKKRNTFDKKILEDVENFLREPRLWQEQNKK